MQIGADGVKLSGDSSDFVLLSEAVPDTYFTFPVNSNSLVQGH